ncbi:MAG: D-tyrosyl-tRNA(Tyr) deacylase [Firmicutes bacterium]|nr:D-tyrosyl-tRNA(Tyr) deacylase [Bacillota bacterium]
MKVVIQRSLYSNVVIENKVFNEISNGLVIFSCFTEGDTTEDISYIIKKITNLRIFDDEDGVMNKSILDTDGHILSISQFTLYADTKKGNRPSYIKALNGLESIKLYELFNEELNKIVPTVTGIFGADMKVNITNDGPVTIIIDSKNK